MLFHCVCWFCRAPGKRDAYRPHFVPSLRLPREKTAQAKTPQLSHVERTVQPRVNETPDVTQAQMFWRWSLMGQERSLGRLTEPERILHTMRNMWGQFHKDSTEEAQIAVALDLKSAQLQGAHALT
jgi:hypothetical protein